MKFGSIYLHSNPRPWDKYSEQRLYNESLEQIELTDKLGFDYAWAVEHHFLEEYSHAGAPEVFLAAASQRTKQIRLAHGIVQLPMGHNHPVRVAERIALLDLISNGRVDFGTGESTTAMELEGFGIDRETKREQWQEALDAITRMFVEEPFVQYEGKYLQMPERNILPKPLQKPHPPLWTAAGRRDQIKLCASNGLGALSFSFIQPEEARSRVEEYYSIIQSEECVPAGFNVNPNFAITIPMLCHEDEETAIERGIDGAHFFGYTNAYYYGFGQHRPGISNLWEDFEKNREKMGFVRDTTSKKGEPSVAQLVEEKAGSLRGAIGTPDQIRELLRKYEEAGVDQVIFVCQFGRTKHEHICESFELFAREVMPEFQEREAAHQKRKQERLGDAVERALSRRKPPRISEGDLVVAAKNNLPSIARTRN
ncbi:LLM class flavin-dependent oxidoreductase [Neobacillus rhizophilus]|uniref:LLM class flavin-dependent oxidoreductase n=1 Tax=Neobacillus rhizophilus TaxID=2833579 RepID=A0A942UAE6_9BACI|nr:LLM class flavin-dependent oxidoreductase [Neobacillus rhizophilus]MBS4215163.1 LLM class flavin-dependent oxidoreductase [Neobacillus rhizophilus]